MNRTKKIRQISALLFSLVMLAGVSATGYADKPRTFMGSFSETRAEGDVVASVEDVLFRNNDEMLASLRADSTPNTATAVETIPAAGIKGLALDVNKFGVVVEPTDKKDVTVELVGVKYPENVTVSTTVANGVLTVKVALSKKTSLLISTVKDDLVNVVRVGIPSGILKGITFADQGGSCILLDGLNVPVSGKVTNGTARVQNHTGARTAAVDMTAENGSVLVRAKTVDCPVTMKVENGNASVAADVVTGKTILSAENGSVELDAGSVLDSTCTAENGNVNLEVGTVTGKLSASVDNGNLACALTRQPQHLKFILNNTHAFYDNIKLPTGWTSGYTVGNGKPVLELGVDNGTLQLTIDSK